ncbi:MULTISPECIES: NAD(P)/FAD-dependent oxidoreductase [Neobacillus]|uniref:NAD(P)/FAD-dependent oxidoreductase n=1 Tax=Neobacillus rhizophilus TaxID=2833579 RepID=A0A942YVN4_9BACI|nr:MULTISPECIES: NAD(P)/FAD-dependent oxidoreductase [Neobacillus]MBS4214122.1 NAD(P)/FAD-dependent oxidoreductase [Neobacillus rhizophilus]
MMLDCVIVGGGPAGLNAALVLGRARRNVILFDNSSPRNAVTQESHGFITRDGIKPREFREIAHQDIAKYPSVMIRNEKITDIKKKGIIFELVTEEGECIQTKKVILATGLKEIHPSVENLMDYYGKSLFSCPYCDGWELKDRPLIVLSELPSVFHMVKTVYNWSKNLIVCTNGHKVLTTEQKDVLQRKEIKVFEQKIKTLVGENGFLEAVIFEDDEKEKRDGGFVTPEWIQASPFGKSLGCEINQLGGIITDELGRTNIEGVYAAGDTSVIAPSQVIIAAAQGSRAAIGVNTDLTLEDFN